MKIKSPTNDCPTCDGLKAKNSYTCMECFKLGKRKRNPHNNAAYLSSLLTLKPTSYVSNWLANWQHKACLRQAP